MRNAISVDLEDWYHICGVENSKWAEKWEKYSCRLIANVEKILTLLDEFDVKATFFVVGYIAEKEPSLIKIIADRGHELASHGYFHRRIFDMTPEEFEEDLLRSKKSIELASGQKVVGYRAPEWSLKKECAWALDILKKNGFEYDSSVNPLSQLSGKGFGIAPGKISTRYGDIQEFPLPTFRMFSERVPFSGGLPLRITPQCCIVEFTKRLNRNHLPIMLYMHPWELDNSQEKIDLPLNRKFMHYFNRKVTLAKVRHLLKHFNFAPVSSVLGVDPPKEEETLLKKSWKPDGVYVASFARLLVVSIIGYVGLFMLPNVLGYYSLLLILIGLTILYWPWTAISNMFECVKK